MIKYSIVIIGGGPAGLAAAIEAKKNGIDDILIIERDERLGGILNQCIHSGFGLHVFKEELTGPEYAQKFVDMIQKYNINYKLNTMVIDIDNNKKITAVNGEDGIIEIQATSIILAMGCRERPRGAINIPGSRCAGVYAAGTAQKFVNIDGYMPGKEVVILGSGDIGLIMARRMTLEGAKVKVVLEVQNYSGGLKRNIAQCLEDFNIPLKLAYTVINIHGKDRVEGVTVAKVDENRRPIKGTEEFIKCDTLLLSVGLVPENELSKKAGIEISKVTLGPLVNESLETNIDGIFACGNVLHVHDLVDNVTMEGYKVGKNASEYINGKQFMTQGINIKCGIGIKYTVPVMVNPKNIDKIFEMRFRVDDVYRNNSLNIYFDDKLEISKKKKIFTPGEMETVIITKEIIDKYPSCKEIIIKIAED